MFSSLCEFFISRSDCSGNVQCEWTFACCRCRYSALAMQIWCKAGYAGFIRCFIPPQIVFFLPLFRILLFSFFALISGWSAFLTIVTARIIIEAAQVAWEQGTYVSERVAPFVAIHIATQATTALSREELAFFFRRRQHAREATVMMNDFFKVHFLIPQCFSYLSIDMYPRLLFQVVFCAPNNKTSALFRPVCVFVRLFAL